MGCLSETGLWETWDAYPEQNSSRFAQPHVVEPVNQFSRISEWKLLRDFLEPLLGRRKSGNIARKMIAHFGSAIRAIAAPPHVLRNVYGIDPTTLRTMNLVKRMAICLLQAEVYKFPVLENADAAANFLIALASKQTVEQLWVLYLATNGRILSVERVATGTVNHCIVYPHQVVEGSLRSSAAGVILAHNHPSGDPSPSKEDVALTCEIYRALDVLDVYLVDHIIVANGCWTSFRREGLLRRCNRHGRGCSPPLPPGNRVNPGHAD